MEVIAYEDGSYGVKDVSTGLSQEEALQLITDEFGDEIIERIGAGESFVPMEVTAVDQTTYTTWFLVPKRQFRNLRSS